ncbi:AlkA N-terminal domain-containing protein [Microbulbifer yueqingensis]|uniref:AlkA N-terminal domain-containing protein n=1 Tax=Microbulbifer yueqingensis TaxID=658219 RepID=UPI001FE17D55|nr:AlkA N-terminal domain-containing protein [Microbulbifer yueqingensis]
MLPSPEICARARLARDRRFDGCFFTAVRTTGIFCRPVCPARAPREENVEYFGSATEAAAAGYRPCLRCRPDAAPGSPAWGLVETTVRRALDLMRREREGMSVETLAGRLGISSRYLRRLFAEHLGMSPLQYWQVERVLFAQGLLRDTDLPVTRVALEAGFNSTRRFNAVFRRVCQCTPREVRAASPVTGSAGGARLWLSYRPPFSWQRLLSFLWQRALPGVERVEGAAYERSFVLDGRPGVVRVTDDPEKCRLRVEVESDGATALYLVSQRLRKLFDLDADSGEISRVLAADPLLARQLGKFPGVRLPGAWDPFEYSLRAILGQQISAAAATTIAGRLVERHGVPFVDRNGCERRLFPDADSLAAADFEGLGLTRARAATLRAFVAASLDGRVDFTETDLERWCAQLTALPGIGEWTAQYIAMRGLSLPDAFPASDLGILLALGVDGKKATPAQARARAEQWRPWRAYGALLLWQSLQSGD